MFVSDASAGGVNRGGGGGGGGVRLQLRSGENSSANDQSNLALFNYQVHLNHDQISDGWPLGQLYDTVSKYTVQTVLSVNGLSGNLN
jgi:hypothetical protein